VQLRPYQQETLTAIVDNYKAGIRQQLVVWSTGTGKTCLAANLPTTLKGLLDGKMLFVAHRDQLLTQAIDKIQTWNPSLKIGLEKAESRASLDCDVIVASVASIGRTGSTRMQDFWEHISVIVLDESHHCISDSFLRVLEDSGVLKDDSKKLLVGLTATPRRRNRTKEANQKNTLLDDEDLISLKSVFKKIVYSYPLRKAIKDGYLVPLRGFRVSTRTSLDGVKTVAGDFQIDALSDAVNTTDRNALVVKAWKEHAEGRQTAAFTCTIQHAKDLAEVFMHNGVLAQPIWGEDPQKLEKLRWFEEGKIQVLANCSLLSEGWDSPTVSCIVQARPTKSSTLYCQMIGRGTRLFPSKQDCIVLDFCDSHKRCSLTCLPSLLGLNPEMDLHGESVIKAAEKIEALEEAHPGIDFKDLTDLSKVKAYVEALDLFADPFTQEVKEYSKLKWMEQADGSYSIAIPEEKGLADAGEYYRFRHEALHISQNQLEEYELSITSVDPERALGTFSTLKEALETADNVLQRCRPDRLKLLQRNAPCHDNLASDGAKKYLARLSKKRPVHYCLCLGQTAAKGICPSCGKQLGITAGQATLAIEKMKIKGEKK